MQLLRFVGDYKKKMFLLQSASTYIRRDMVAVNFFSQSQSLGKYRYKFNYIRAFNIRGKTAFIS